MHFYLLLYQYGLLQRRGIFGGLNYQVEHHLFPNICHVHYKDISKIVKETAIEYNLPYYSYVTFYGAVKDHAKLLKRLGRQDDIALSESK